jgi:hypothetical protein
MVRNLVRSACLFALLSLASAGASQAQNLVSYDTFAGPSVNIDKWFGVEFGTEDDAPNLEASRQIASNRLSLLLRAGGDRQTDDSVHTSVTGLVFRDPRGISQIALDVVPGTTASVANCPANSETGVSGIGVLGAFYNEETNFPGPADIFAIIVVGRVVGVPTPANRLEVRGFVFSEENSSGDAILIGEVDLGTILKTTTARLSVEWDPATDEIKFQVNNRPVETVQGPPSVGEPDENFKLVGAITNVENCTAAQTIGQVKGAIDNVSIKRLP